MSDNQPTKKNSVKEFGLTVVLFGLVATMTLSGAQMMEIINLPRLAQLWIGAVLVSSVVVGGTIIIHLAVKQLFVKKG